MDALRLHLRAELRNQWRSLIATVLLIGLIGGVVIAAVAGARRTDTAFDRLLDDTDAWDVLINPNEGIATGIDLETVQSLAVVERAYAGYGMAVFLLDDDGDADFDEVPLSVAGGSDDARVAFGRPHVLEGRLLDNRVVEEVMVSESIAQARDVDVGDTLPVAVFRLAELEAFEEAGGDGEPPLDHLDLTVTGIFVEPDELLTDDLFSSDSLILSRAFADERSDDRFFVGYLAQLADGPDAFGDLQAQLAAASPDGLIEIRQMAVVADTVARGVRPHVFVLVALAAIVGLAGTVISVQAVTRQLEPLRRDAPGLRAVGIGRGQLVVAGFGRVVGVAAAGGVVAALVAVAASPVFPIGVARKAEVSPGIDVDVVSVGGGVVVLVASTVVLSWLGVRRVASPDARRTRRERSSLLPRISTGPVSSSGLRLAFGPATESTGRPAIGGLALAFATLAATVTFGSSLSSFIATPAEWGWTWDALVGLNNEPAPGEIAPIVDRFAAEPNFDAVGEVIVDQASIAGLRVPSIGIDQRRSTVDLPVPRGRAPRADDEVALGGRTLAALDVGIGDTVAVGPDGESFTVVGQAVFPGIGTYSGSDRTGLGTGALFTIAGLRNTGEGFAFPSIIVDAADPVALAEGIESATGGARNDDLGDYEVFDRPQRPADVTNLGRIESTPVAIAAVLGCLALLSFAHSVRASSRVSRRSLALLKSLGMGRGSIRSVVTVQTLAPVAVALVVGLPIGVAAGRSAWVALGDRLGIAAGAHVPASLAVFVPVAIVVAAVASLVPARRAARIPAADVLRSE